MILKSIQNTNKSIQKVFYCQYNYILYSWTVSLTCNTFKDQILQRNKNSNELGNLNRVIRK